MEIELFKEDFFTGEGKEIIKRISFPEK